MGNHETYPKRVSVNTTDLELAIREGCKSMQRLFDPRNDLAYWENAMSGEKPKNGHHDNFTLENECASPFASRQ